MHSLWSGSISFGLINIPVTIYSATEDTPLDFDMLRKDDLCPISYVRVCKKDGQEVPYEDIVKGYEVKEGQWVVLEKEDFKRAAAKKSDTIDIEEFVSERDIDPIYFEKPYYLEPGKGADKAYVLLREALRQAKKVAIATFVFRNKEDLVMLKPYDDIIVLNQLRFQHQIRATDELNIPKAVPMNRREIEMAVKLVEQLEGEFKPEKFKDTYVDSLKKLIKAKAKGQTYDIPEEERPHVSDPNDLIAQLQASLERSSARARR
jgi:DNA end-binding protein Ku